MLALRLRGSRSIRAQCNGPSCRAQVARVSTTGRGRAIALARGYATESTKSDEQSSTEGMEPEKLFRKMECADPRGKRRKLSTLRQRSDTKASKSTNAKKQGADAPTADATTDGAKKPKLKTEDHSPTDADHKADTIKILREATLLLREFQANPAKFASKKKKHDGDEGGKGGKRSLKTQFDPIQGAPKYDERQTKIFYETLTVLGDALQIYAKSTAGKDKQSDADIAAAKDAMAQATMANSGMGTSRAGASDKSDKTAETKQKQSSKKKAEPELEPEEKSQGRQKTKKKGQSQPEKKEIDEAPLKSGKRTRARKDPEPVISDSVSQSLASVVARARADPKIRKAARKSKSEGEADSSSRKSKKKKHDIKIENFRADSASALTPIEVDVKPVPLIQYGLDRVLFKDGVYPLQDPRTRVWNFDPYLANIMPVTDFDFDALKEYITSSKDQKLINITKDESKKYTGSTSSMTSTLAHFHFLLSQWRPINCARLSKQFDVALEGFSGVTKAPAATILNYKDGVYAIDADKEWDTETVLSMLGKSMEKLMTVPKDEFVKYHRSKSHQLTEEEKGQEESYHYTTYGDFMMRSQLDAYDPRLPGTGVYDLKTRAVVSIRMDAANVQKGVGYEIRQRDGNWESFEREYFDMIRAAFLKYSLQVRMGRMDGIFVAFHNTERIFGFQYIPLEEMDLSLHGTTDKTLGDREFTASLKLFNELLNQAIAKFPEQSLRVHVETRPSEQVPFLYFFAEPVNDEQIKQIQEMRNGAVEKFKARLGIPTSEKANAGLESAIEEGDNVEAAVEAEEEPVETDEAVEVEEEDSDQVWEDMMEVVEDTMDKDAEGITAIREAIQEALGQSGLLRAKSSEEAQHYVEALLKSIVNPYVELAKNESQGQEDDEAVQQSTTAKSVEPTPEQKPSAFGSLFSWLRPSTPVPEVPIKETTNEDASPENASPENSTEAKDAMKEPENGPSPELVELLVKLTSRVGTISRSNTANEKAKQQELSDDQARLRSFESILLDMMPNVLESAEEIADEKRPPAAHTGDSSAAAGSPKSEAEKDSLFAMYVTVRNKVNDEPVDRPENLADSDTWDIEYAMEELHGERAEKLYRACKARRKATLDSKSGRDRSFNTMFDGALPKYIQAGRSFRQQENKIAKTQPVWIVGQPAPLPANEVFKGAGAKLVHVLPSLEHGRPIDHLSTLTDQDLPLQYSNAGAGARNPYLPRDNKKNTRNGRGPLHQESIKNSKVDVADGKESVDKKGLDKDCIAESVAKLRKSEETKASTFKEWRENAKQQDKP